MSVLAAGDVDFDVLGSQFVRALLQDGAECHKCVRCLAQRMEIF